MSGGLYLGSITLRGQQSVLSTISKQSGVLSNPFSSLPELELPPAKILTVFLFSNFNLNKANGSTNGTPENSGSFFLDNSLTPINITNFKCISFYGSITTSTTTTFLSIAYSIDGNVWFKASLGGVITPLTINVDGSRPLIPFSRDFETASPYVSLSTLYNMNGNILVLAVPPIVPPATTPVVKAWSAVAISSSGQYQLAACTLIDGILYTSSDFGITWTAAGSTPTNVNWSSVSVAGTGQFQTACVSGGGIYYSTNYGAAWTQSTAENITWQAVSVSRDGEEQTACVYGGGIYTSSNYGATWTQSSIPLLENWSSVSLSSTGKYQTACVGNVNGGIYTSSNYGVSWAAVPTSGTGSAPTANWVSVSVSATGQYQTACIDNEDTYTIPSIYTSSDYGATWTTKPLIDIGIGLGDFNVTRITSSSISGDGNYIAILFNYSEVNGVDGGLWIFTFDLNKFARVMESSVNDDFRTVAVSFTGQYIIYAQNGGNVMQNIFSIGDIHYGLSI